MFDNGLNRDTVYYIGLRDLGWQTTAVVCHAINTQGLAITMTQTEALLFSLQAKGRVENDFITLDDGTQCNIWKKRNATRPTAPGDGDESDSGSGGGGGG